MALVTLEPRRLHWLSSGFRRIAFFLTGLILMGSVAIDANGSDADPARKIDPLLEEDRVHKLSIYSFLPPFKRGRFSKKRRRSVPILEPLTSGGQRVFLPFANIARRFSRPSSIL